MKKQIVIKINKTNVHWSGEIYGKINNKKTESKLSKHWFADPNQCVTELKENIPTIEQWMEQIQ